MTRILLVDDSPVDVRLYTDLLQKDSDFKVHSCGDGVAALEAMAQNLPRVVITDMQMPNMDGLELVQKARARFPSTPVILLTAHGSEALATKALKAGAAGYVPKAQSGDSLVATVQHVLELSKSQDVDRRIHGFTKLLQYELALENDESLIAGVLQLARQRMSDYTAFDPGTLLQVEVALEQAMLNAIYHGNLEFKQYGGIEFDKASRQKEAKSLVTKPPYSDRRVGVVMRITPEEARFVVKDEGAGFDVKEVSSLGLTHSLRGEFGQGLFLMWAFMDKVLFDKTGSTVTLIKRAPKPVAEPDASDDAQDEAAVKMTIRLEDGINEYQVTRDRITLGRDSSCDFVVDSSSASYHHCVLYLHEGWWFVQDLKSRNGIKVNGKAFENHLLPPNAVLTVGKVNFVVDYQPHKLGAVGITPPVNPF